MIWRRKNGRVGKEGRRRRGKEERGAGIQGIGDEEHRGEGKGVEERGREWKGGRRRSRSGESGEIRIQRRT